MTRRMTGRAILRDLAAHIADRIDQLPDQELRALRRRLRELNRTNCWWLEGELGPALFAFVQNVIRSRTFQRRSAAQKRRRRKVQL